MKINNNVQNVLNKTNDSYKRSYQMLEKAYVFQKEKKSIHIQDIGT